MKTTKTFLLAFFLLASFNLLAQSNSKIIAVVNKADWCPVCEANGERMMKEVFPSYQEPRATIISNDITDEKTIAASKKDLEKLEVYHLVEKEKRTGLITLIDPKSKKVLGTISVAKPTDEIKKFIDKAIKDS